MGISKINLAVLLAITAISAAAADLSGGPEGYALERTVLFMRHGVRPPTKSAAELAPLSDQAWPNDQAWGAAPGELTPHGAQAIRSLGRDLRQHYLRAGLLAPNGADSGQIAIWADGADQRTRETGKALATTLTNGTGQSGTVAWSTEVLDPLFDGLAAHVCKFNPEAANGAVLAQGALENRETAVTLAKMQRVMAPDACTAVSVPGAGSCLAGPSQIKVTEHDVKIAGPLAIASTASEVFLLEYENGLPMAQVGFGRVDAGTIAQLLSIHEHTSDLIRRTPYIATRRAYALVQFILAALSNQHINENTGTAAPAIRPQQRLIVLVGHDTNLSNLAGVFGLNWQLPEQPDSTAPGTTLAFERWKNSKTGKVILQMRLFYQSMEQVRTLSDTPARQISIRPAACQQTANCELDAVVTQVESILPKDCS